MMELLFYSIRVQECQEFGEIRAFKFIKQLDSAVVVFNDVSSAIDCKLVMQSKRLVSFGAEVTDEELARHQLAPPPNEKAFFISPPVSPPPGWTSHKEHPPVLCHDDVTEKLSVLLESSAYTPAIVLERSFREPTM